MDGRRNGREWELCASPCLLMDVSKYAAKKPPQNGILFAFRQFMAFGRTIFYRL
jgi:hypothetical protein